MVLATRSATSEEGSELLRPLRRLGNIRGASHRVGTTEEGSELLRRGSRLFRWYTAFAARQFSHLLPACAGSDCHAVMKPEWHQSLVGRSCPTRCVLDVTVPDVTPCL